MAQKHVYKLNSLISLWGGSLLNVLMCPGNTEHGLKARARLKTQLSQISDFFSPTFKSDFSIFTYSQIYMKLNLKTKIQDFQTLSYFPIFTYCQI